MLEPIRHILSKQRIILASSSPRRKTILGNTGLNFEVVPSTFPEDLDKSLFKHSSDYVCENARIKAMEVANKLKPEADLIIGCDTVVTMDDVIYEKPRDKDHGIQMIKNFNGKWHTVYSGVCLVRPNKDPAKSDEFITRLFHEATEVQMAQLPDDVIKAYVETGEPMDKAGGYGIQAKGGSLIEGIKGDYFNVMGFPLRRVSVELYNWFKDSS